MSLNHPRPGPQSVSEYQVSSLPWVTSSVVLTGVTKEESFNYVSRFVTVKNVGTNPLAVAFSSTGHAAGKSIVLTQNETFTAEIRVKSLWFTCTSGPSSNYQLFAGLTLVPKEFFPALTGSMGLSI